MTWTIHDPVDPEDPTWFQRWWQEEILFMLFSVCNGASVRKYEAHWHMNFSLINGCGTHKNNICGHSFF